MLQAPSVGGGFLIPITVPYRIVLTCVGVTSDLSMPSDVALVKSASATLIAIEIRFEVLKGSSS